MYSSFVCLYTSFQCPAADAESNLAGHMSIREGDSEFSTVVGAIRAIHPLVPVLVFGGHHHVCCSTSSGIKW